MFHLMDPGNRQRQPTYLPRGEYTYHLSEDCKERYPILAQVVEKCLEFNHLDRPTFIDISLGIHAHHQSDDYLGRILRAATSGQQVSKDDREFVILPSLPQELYKIGMTYEEEYESSEDDDASMQS